VVLNQYMDDEDYQAVKDLGYYPCKENILLDLEFVEPRGMSMALPPENMHVVLFGIFPSWFMDYPRCAKLFKHQRKHTKLKRKVYIMYLIPKSSKMNPEQNWEELVDY